eukprot:13528553-Alexandrium_andersonii.AAC.1
MSASLVGSEMCIRDRASESANHRQLAGPLRGSVRKAGSARGHEGGACPCLLYTSDAADDM